MGGQRERRASGAPSRRTALERSELAAILERVALRAREPAEVLDGVREACVRGMLGWDDLREAELLLQASLPAPVAAVERARRSPGAPLPDRLRRRFEASTGSSLGDVRVHTGEASAEAAGRLGARAWVLGRDLHFGPGQYDPASARGAALLAHEVAHAVQQGRPASFGTTFGVSHPRDADERSATSAIPALLAGQRVALEPLGSFGGARVQRDALSEQPVEVRRETRIDTTRMFGMHPGAYFREGLPALPSAFGFDYEGPCFGGARGGERAIRDGFARLALSLLGLDPSSGDVLEGPTGEDGTSARSRRPEGNRVMHFTVDLGATPLGEGGLHDLQFSLLGGTRVIIEDLGPRVAHSPLSEERAAAFGIVQDEFLGPDLWSRVLEALGGVPDAVLATVQGLAFVPGLAARSPEGFVAEYDPLYDERSRAWTYRIRIYTDAATEPLELFRQTLAHELGHAVSRRPSEVPGEAHDSLSARDAYRTAVREDGGRAITAYGGTDDEESFAESFSFYVTRPELLRSLRPHVYAYFRAYQETAEANPTAPRHPGTAPAPAARGGSIDDDFGALDLDAR